MSSRASGKNTLSGDESATGITSVNRDGIWFLAKDREYFIPFRNYRKLRSASVERIWKVKFFPPGHLRWNELDVDIELDALEEPEKFPLEYRG